MTRQFSLVHIGCNWALDSIPRLEDDRTVDRRNFMQLSSLLLADLAIGGPVSCTTPAPHPAPYAGQPSKKGRILMCLRNTQPDKSRFRVFDWDDHSFTEIEIPIGLVHSVIQDDHDQNILYFFEIFGSCLRYDLTTGKTVLISHRGKREMFSGHGTVTTSGEFVACTEIDREVGSQITLRTAADLRKVHVLPKECNHSHHVVSLPKSPLLAAGVMRGYDGKEERGAISLYDSEKRELVNRFEFEFPVLHLMPLSPTEVVGLSLLTRYDRDEKTALSNDRETRENIKTFTNTQRFVPGPIYYVSTDGTTKTLWSEKDKQVFADSFGLAKVSPKRFLSGHHTAGKVILWDDFKMVRMFDVPRAKNLIVSRDGTELLALSEELPMIYSMTTFEPIKVFNDWPPVVCFSGYS